MNRSQRRSDARRARRQALMRAPVERSKRKHVTLAFFVGALLGSTLSMVALLTHAASA